MTLQRMANDSVHWFLEELTSRIVAETGIPSDRHHLGKIILQSFKDDPDFIMQIDGATGESETNRSALKRTVRCAICMRNLGLGHGDVVVLMAPSHIDLTIPFYAALYLGVIIAAVDRTLTNNELQQTFANSKPKLIFCQSNRAPDVQLTLNNLNLDAQIVSFDKGDYLCSFSEFMEKYGDDSPVEDFKCADFDPEDSEAFLIATSGTTGLPKAAAITHKNSAIVMPYTWSRSTTFPTPTRVALVGSPLQWLTAIINCVISPMLRYTRLQSSQPLTQQHAYDIINKFKPTYTIFSPTMLTTLLNPGDRHQCDFSSLELVMLGGSAVPQSLIDEMKEVCPNTDVVNVYGMSEVAGIVFHGDNPAPGSCGKPMGCYQYRIVNVETQKDIYEPNVPGELWIKGPSVFKEYYKNPKATEETFAEGRWFKTGDTFYRDVNWNFFFVERIKLLLKYKSYQISPVELEAVIRQHPGVLDVAVTGIPDAECGELPVACVVPRPGSEPTAEDIKELIRGRSYTIYGEQACMTETEWRSFVMHTGANDIENLSDAKHLRGGVIFMDALPVTASTKVHRRKLKEMALELPRE